MKSEKITVTSTGKGMAEALATTVDTAANCGLTGKDAIRLKLLSEETLGMLRQITGEVSAVFWIESEGKRFELHLAAHPVITETMRAELLSVSSSGKNAAAVGLMGKLKDIFERAIAVRESGMANVATAKSVNWSMKEYKTVAEQQMAKDAKAREEWDELEKSIVANIADEVTVAIRGGKVEMTVYKQFDS